MTTLDNNVKSSLRHQLNCSLVFVSKMGISEASDEELIEFPDSINVCPLVASV